MDLAKNLLPLQRSTAGASPTCVCATSCAILESVPTTSVLNPDRDGFLVFKDCVTKAYFHEFIALLCTEWIQQLNNCSNRPLVWNVPSSQSSPHVISDKNAAWKVYTHFSSPGIHRWKPFLVIERLISI